MTLPGAQSLILNRPTPLCPSPQGFLLHKSLSPSSPVCSSTFSLRSLPYHAHLAPSLDRQIDKPPGRHREGHREKENKQHQHSEESESPMKFGKKLRALVDDSYEEWRPMFISYKALKKRIHPRAGLDDVESRDSDSKADPDQDEQESELDLDLTAYPVERARLVAAVRDAETTHIEFFTCFRREVDKVNDFFLDKQEDYIIEHQRLSSRVDPCLKEGSATRQEVNHLRQRLTNFHGELVLLENFSTVNYTGFRKILKKHDKKTGLCMQKFYLKTVLTTPFFLSDTVRKLILRTESQLAQLDNIRKYRRTSPTSALTLHGPSLASLNHPPSSASHTPAPVSFPPYTQLVMEHPHPHPHAFISPRSALWRLYRDTREYSNAAHAAISAPGAPSLPQPPPSLVSLVDEVQAAELGLSDAFLQAVNQPSNYCIAAEQNFSIGFFVLGPQTKLQLFRSIHEGTIITRNLRGKIRLRCFKNFSTCTDKDAPTLASRDAANAGADNEQVDTHVEEWRRGFTTGPWPAVTSSGSASHVEWAPETWSAIFYVCVPALALDVLPKYELHALGDSRYAVTQDSSHGWPFMRIQC